MKGLSRKPFCHSDVGSSYLCSVYQYSLRSIMQLNLALAARPSVPPLDLQLHGSSQQSGFELACSNKRNDKALVHRGYARSGVFGHLGKLPVAGIRAALVCASDPSGGGIFESQGNL